MYTRASVLSPARNYTDNLNSMDHRKIMKALVAIVMTAALVILILLIVNQVKAGLTASNSKMMLAGYAAMALYAAYRIYANIRDIFKS